ncbi:two-component sensor histidine kinase [Paenibacillus selenitireducens]|uniref:Two-component sensor histidine kinase n=1 Tax=Paenibacillus selenitireducens TaxID=1324314 RepID=A0A1T2XG55_9BACL|nr:histidine kinase [Paenibacillus selenitireducens]OPA78656.1 two-component sensor histidine kinase [Paenibacillus selenitireducens]
MDNMRKPPSTIFNSLRFKLITGLMLIMLPIVLFLIYTNFYSIQVVRNQVAQSNSNMISLYTGLIDKSLADIDNYLLKYASEVTGLHVLDRSPEIDIDLYKLERIWQFKQLVNNVTYYEGLDYFFIYSPINNDLVFAPKQTGSADADNQPIKDAIVSLIDDGQSAESFQTGRWSVFRVNKKDYLLYIIKVGGLYIGAGVNTQDVTGPLNLLDLGADGRALLVDGNHKPLKDESFFREQGIDLSYTPKSYRLSGFDEGYLVIGEHSGKGDFGLVAVVPDQSILQKLPYLQRIISLIAAGTVLILLLAFYFMRRVVLRPINRIVLAMRRIKEGHLEMRIAKKPTSNEFELMNEMFNSMVTDIQKLKIDVYEEQLINQKAELKHLQLQVNPHFFLNSLNVVYYLAQERKYGLIQELSLSLIRYFRFMFRSHTDHVLVRDELGHTKNYLNIQKIRFPGSLTYAITVPDDLLDCCIPPLIIQSFAENTIKHAINTDEPTHIEISIERDSRNDEERLHIRIRDTGMGYEDEMLEKLRQEIKLTTEEGEHIGIWNARQRLRLLYGGQAIIGFSNDNGAVVDIFLPIMKG